MRRISWKLLKLKTRVETLKTWGKFILLVCTSHVIRTLAFLPFRSSMENMVNIPELQVRHLGQNVLNEELKEYLTSFPCWSWSTLPESLDPDHIFQ